ncbi:hypothetical protein PybrP1_011711 [[Pythium] brassicae (nom. inval.)]|nr:hypothetical protein PybrP1_011711 [[Pythium] brassicae (nom. inval.)]
MKEEPEDPVALMRFPSLTTRVPTATTHGTTLPALHLTAMTNTDAQMQLAIAAVAGGGLSVRKAARRFGVPRTTLQRKLSKDSVCPQHDMKGTSAANVGSSTTPTKTPGDDAAERSTFSLQPPAMAASDDAAALASAFDMTQSSINSILSLYESNGNGTSAGPVVSTSNVGRKRPIDAVSAPSEQQPPLRKGSALDELSNEMIMDGKTIYKLGLGQSPFPIPQCVVDELRAHSQQREYLPAAGLPGLRDDIAAWGTRTLHMKYTRDDVLVGPGTKELLFVLQTVYYGDLLLPNPSCTSYAPQASIAGRNMIWLPTSAADRWVLRPEVLEDHCAKDPDAPRILILNSPSNPTGCVYNEQELIAVAQVARKYRVLVISDEIYSELHHSGEHLSISKYYPEGTIVSGGLSKWCGAGGWRMGFWMFPASMNWLRKSMLVMASETYTSVASPIQHAARRAFVPNCIELAAYKGKCRKTLQIIGHWFAYQMQKMNLDVQLPRGGFTMFPSFARHRRALAQRGIATDVQLCAQLLHDTGVAILPGSCFGRSPDELYVRIAFVDFKGEIALYLIETMDLTLEAIDGFIQSVCPNLDIAMRKLANWLSVSLGDTLLAPILSVPPVAVDGDSTTGLLPM